MRKTAMELLVTLCAVGLLHAVSAQTEITTQADVINVTVSENSDVILPCHVDVEGNHQVVWIDSTNTILTYNDNRIVDIPRFSVDRPSSHEWNLRIQDVRHSDQGIYRCSFRSVGDITETKTVRLTVQEHPEIALQPDSMNVTVTEGGLAILPCHMENLGLNHVVWMNTDETILAIGLISWVHDPRIQVAQPSEDDWNLHIEDVHQDDQGEYICRRSNNYLPQHSKRVFLNVVVAPEIYLPNKRIAQTKGMDAILECTVTAFPHAVSYWQKDGQRIVTPTSKYRLEVYLEEDNRLTLSLRVFEIDESDYGPYTCIASNEIGDDAETMSLVPPTELSPTYLNVTENSDAVLPCHVDAIGYQHVAWLDSTDTILTIDDNRIINRLRLSVDRPSLNDWNLRIQDVRHSDQGEYRCFYGTIGSMTQTKTVRLTVQDQAEMTPEAGVVTVNATEHSVAILPCQMENIGLSQVIWMEGEGTFLTFGTMTFIEDSRIRVLHPSENHWNLRIDDVHQDDQGEYICMRSHHHSTEDVQRVFLNVSAGPRRVITIVVTEHSTVVLPCRVTVPATDRISWRNPEDLVLTIDDRRINVDPRFSVQRPTADDWNLQIQDVQLNDQGEYKCQASSSTNSIKRVQLRVLDSNANL